MSSPLVVQEKEWIAITQFADHATAVTVEILNQRRIAKDTVCLRMAVPPEMCAASPGQFFMLRNVLGTDPLIGRAFALYDCDPVAGWIEIVYLVKGKLTTSVAQLSKGDLVGLCGPLGNSFSDAPARHLIMVAGGIGQTPFLSLAKEALGRQQFAQRHSGYAEKVSFCYGARTAEYFAGVDSFRHVGAEVHLATEDGSMGAAERVTGPLERLLAAESDMEGVRVVCCGPEPMMEAVASLTARYRTPCQVSLETPMACGIGICFTCVAKVGRAEDWDYKRTCVEGPIFEAGDIVWH